MRYTGIAASPGIGMGPVFRYEREELAVRETVVPAGGEDAELARYRAALESSREDLRRIRDSIASELSDFEARIYDAHLMLLDDPELDRAVEQGVRAEHRGAAAVFLATMVQAASRLETSQDEYLRERHADILDVARRVLRALVGAVPQAVAELREPSIIVAHDLGPSEVALLRPEVVLAFVTEVGGRTSHGAIVARGRGIPAVVGVRGVVAQVRTGQRAAVDGYAGVFEIEPEETATRDYAEHRRRIEDERRQLDLLHDEPAVTLDGHRLELGANIELPSEADAVLASGADSIGLFRTEFFYMGRPQLPTEEEQVEAYRTVARRLSPRPVLFRTMDLGGDKVASYLGVTHEANPFLGWRGIRFALHHPEVFRAQLRAIYRASAHGRVRMMFPMVSNESELLRALELCADARAELDRAGEPYDPGLEIGMMIETPSAVWMSDALARHAAFFSIGTNDLVQYTMAMDRGNERLAYLYEPLEPAVLRSIAHTCEAAHRAGRWVGLCGEMAGDPRSAALLVGLGVDELSMSPFDVPRVKAALRSLRYDHLAEAAHAALECASADAVKAILREQVDSRLPAFLVPDRSRDAC
jgi:phosphoenolpyruvate-protein phosphotransferase (PTS system enzyme I)